MNETNKSKFFSSKVIILTLGCFFFLLLFSRFHKKIIKMRKSKREITHLNI